LRRLSRRDDPLIKRILLIFLLLFIAVSFISLPRNPLQNDDASLYALAAKNAIVHGQWLAQFISPGDLSSFLDKPPLGIWLLAWFPKLVGLNELTIHFPNVLYYAILLFILYRMVSWLATKELAFNSTLIAATSLALVVYSRAPKLDVLLTLFMLTAHLSLYAYLKKDKPVYLYPFALSLAFGFLVKSGFGLIMTATLLIFLFIFNAEARQKLLKALFSFHSAMSLLLLLAIVGGVLYAQSFALKGEWLNYLRSITIQSKYNTSYLGFGFYYNIFGLLLITLFPWMPAFFRGLKLKLIESKLDLSSFCRLWFWSNFLFFLFLYRQTDFRTFTILVPPMAILAGTVLEEKKGSKVTIAWAIHYLIIFSLILLSIIYYPKNQQGFSLIDAIIPVALFVASLLALTIYFWKPSGSKLAVSFVLVCLSYSVLFWNTQPIADAFNPDLKWPAMIKQYQADGYRFYIYRPPDRQLFYSPDLFWVDFMAGPADRYFWDGKELTANLDKGKAMVLSDTNSWEKLKISNEQIIAKDSYSTLIITQK